MPSPILIVDDDTDDLELIQAVVEHCGISRPVKYFQSGNELLDFLKSTPDSPFLIIADVNLPAETGFSIMSRISEDKVLRYKSMPFIFWSTASSEKQIKEAYDLPAQGFFIKPSSFDELCGTFMAIVSYWEKSQHPKLVV